jgi:hypothetical protein
MRRTPDGSGPWLGWLSPIPPVWDEFEEYLAEALQDPAFRAAYETAEARYGWCHPQPSARGAEYHRRRKARARRKR